MNITGRPAAPWRWCLAAGLLGVSVAVAAQSLPLPTAVTARSVSGQFVVQGRGGMLPAPASSVRRVGTNQTVTLRPDLLAVTAERTKRGIEQILNAQDPWRGAIHLQIQEAPAVAGPLAVQTRWFRDGWQYAVAVPETVEWERLIRTLVEVTLLERANRANPSPECALVPLWFTTGIHELLMADAGRDLVTESGTLINRSERRPDPLRLVRAQLAGREPMSFGEFSLLGREDLVDPERFRAYQASATLFVHEWLRECGARSATDFLHHLPDHLNWQTTFLRVNGDRFPRLLDVEKWWAVASVEALATDGSQHWPRQRVLDRLAELLTETADVRADTNSPAVRKTLPLRELIMTWDFDSQREVLVRKVAQLRALGVRSPPAIAPLVGDSARVLEEYVQLRSGAVRPSASKANAEVRGPIVAEAAARRLAGLEARLEAERQVRLPQPLVPNDPARTVAPPGLPQSAVRGNPSSGG